MTLLDECLFACHNTVDDLIDLWHKGGTNESLAEYLDMNHDEHASFVQDPDYLEEYLYNKLKAKLEK